MTSDPHFTLLRMILGNQVQIMNALATLLHDGERKEFAEMVLEQATITQRMCEQADAAHFAMHQTEGSA